MTMIQSISTFALVAALPALCLGAEGQLTVKAVNKLPLARASQTIELSAKDLAPLGNNLTLMHVKDAAGKEVLAQALDTDFDARRAPDRGGATGP